MAEEYKLPYSGADIYRRLRDVDSKAKVMTMTTDEYNALGETDANTLYLMTDAEEEEEYFTKTETEEYVENAIASLDGMIYAEEFDSEATMIPLNADTLGGQLPSYYAQAPIHKTITISASGWSSGVPYTQTISVSGVLATDAPHVSPVYSNDVAVAIAQKEAWAVVDDIDSGNGTITFTCFDDKPTMDIPVQIEVNR